MLTITALTPSVRRWVDDREGVALEIASNLRIFRPPAFPRTLLHGVLHTGLACTDATDGRR